MAMTKNFILTFIITANAVCGYSQTDQNETTERNQSIVFSNSAFNIHPEYKSPVILNRGFNRDFNVNAPIKSKLVARSKSIVFEKDRSAGTFSMRAGTIVGLSGSGDTQFIAHYKRNKLRGNWISKFSDDQLCDSGSLRNNVPDGLWKSWYANGNLRFIRHYNAFKLEKAKQDIKLRQSKAVTSAIAVLARTNLQAAYSYLHPDYSFHTLASQPSNFSSYDAWLTLNERVSKNISEESSAYTPPFLECLHHGLYMNFYPDGSVKDSGFYKNGLRHGIWEEWLDDGKTRSQGFYTSGHKTSTWKFYDKKGVLLYVKSYNRNGKEIHRKSFRQKI